MSGDTGNEAGIMDNCTAHTGPEVEEACPESAVVVCPPPSHRSNQISLLDLSTFGIIKHTMGRIKRKESVNFQSSHIAQVVRTLMSAASPLTSF
jgi:hypothetical protein